MPVLGMQQQVCQQKACSSRCASIRHAATSMPAAGMQQEVCQQQACSKRYADACLALQRENEMCSLAKTRRNRLTLLCQISIPHFLVLSSQGPKSLTAKKV